ncbi:saccharopine dehydrogenase NADP-binding domain-containing protein [Spirillospora sp. NPDC047279]|uniref:saccharopine dehydrogenase family protein n=1 Tax=Spirillospora sp. NPDC047279 TaxID=3155478 RepID=UPI0033EEC65C
MKIAVHGASGFTGSLAAAELGRRGIPPILVGRDERRLRRVAGTVGAAEIRVAPLDDHDALTGALAGCDAVVNCAGPFTSLGEPVIRAAIEAGCHYVDTTGEQHYVHRVLKDFRDVEGITIVPALADDGGPGDLIAALTAKHLGSSPADLLIADLRLPGATSRGTARSMAAVGFLDPLEYAGGTWSPVAGGTPGTITVPGEPGEIAVTTFALPGVALAPRHIPAGRVRSAIRTEVAGLFASLTEEVVESVPEIPDEKDLLAARWMMLARATDDRGRQAQGWVTGADAYRMTAVIAVEGARRLAAGGAPSGARTPAEAFDAAGFLDYLEPFGVTWDVTDL